MLPQTNSNSLSIFTTYASLFCGLTIASKLIIFSWPVPFTLQTLYIALMQIFAAKHARIVVITWLGAGIMGAPVFATGGGIHYLINSLSTGYIIGMILSTLLLCTPITNLWKILPTHFRANPQEDITHNTHSLSELLPAKASYIVSISIIYTCGLTYLSMLDIPTKVYNYLAVELFKFMFFTLIYKTYKSHSNKNNPNSFYPQY